MEIPEFDIQVLATIADSNIGKSPEELRDIYGSEVSETINLLLTKELVTVHEHDLKPFMRRGYDYTDPPIGNIVSTRLGKTEIKRWKTRRALEEKERWKERAWGFITGAITASIPWLLVVLTGLGD